MTITLKIPGRQEVEVQQIAFRHSQDPEQFILSLLDEALLFEGMEPIPLDAPEEIAAAAAGIQRGLDDFAAGRYKPAKEVFAAMRARHGIPD